MSSAEALIVALAETPEAEPLWIRVAEGAIVQTGTGANWLAACGLSSLPDDMQVMLVPPAAQVRLQWRSYPDLPARQGRAAARLGALSDAILPADQLFAVAGENDDPARPHLVAVAARADLQHWLLWAQHHGLDPDLIVPAPLLLPEAEAGFQCGIIGGEPVLRGVDMALPGDLALPELIGDAVVRDVPPEAIQARAVAALRNPPIDMRQGDFSKRVRRSFDNRTLGRIALRSGLVLSISLLIALAGLVKRHIAANSLDADSLAHAQKVVPGATDLAQAEAEMNRQLGERGAGGYAFTAPVAGLLNAMQDAPGVSLTALSRDPDGMIRATLAAAKGEDINIVLLSLQADGFTITATSAQDPGGRVLADITVRS